MSKEQRHEFLEPTLPLPRESHQRRIQCNRQQQMTNRNRCHRQDSNKICDMPAVRDEWRNGQNNHTSDTDNGKRNAKLEPLQHLRDLNKEIRELCFFRRSTPCHVDLEHVCEQSLRDMEGETTEEDSKHENPFEILEECAEEGFLADAVAHEGESDVSETVEDNDD